MKVKKEQFLLPKAKTNATSTTNTKWIQPMRKTCEFPKTLTCTSVSSQPILEGLPLGLVTKIKPDVRLPAGDIIVSGHPSGQLIWKQQNRILRQALMTNEKDVKCEEKNGESLNIECGQNLTHIETCVVPTVTPGTSLLAIAAMPPQQITPIATSQVINVNDYQVILSTDTLPTPWQDKRRRSSNQKLTSLPPIKPKMGPGQVTFTSLGNVNILGQNQKQFPTIVIKDAKSPLPKNVIASNTAIHQNPLPKKVSNKTSKTFKVRKKPNHTRKIMLKPTSSLLAQTAFDCRNGGYIGSQSNISQTTNLHIEKSTDIETIIKTSAEPIALVSTSLPVSTPNVTQNSIHPLNSVITSKCTVSNVSNITTHFNEPSDYSDSVSKSKENDIIYNTQVVDFSVSNHTVEIYSEPEISEQTVILHSNELQKNVVHTDQGVNSSNCKTPIQQNNELKGDNSNMESLIDLTRSEDFHSNHIETIILPSDMEHHEEHHTQEYTDNLLSQLSNSGALPNMSSSQVSSVLNALGSSEKSVMNTMGDAEKSTKESVKCEPMEFVKIENLHVINSLKTKNKSTEPKYRICELNKITCFRCISCMYLSLKTENVERHWLDHHKIFRPRCSEKQSKRQIKCIGCTNIFYSKYALQIHLLCDHNITTTEVHDFITVILSANRNQTESKRQSLKSNTLKTNEDDQEPEAVKIIDDDDDVPSALPDPTYQADESATIITAECLAADPEPDLLMETSVILSQPPKADEQKLTSDQEQETPSTPSFGLFSEVHDLKDKEEPSSQVTDLPTTDNESQKIISYKKVTKNIRRYKTTKNKIRPDFASEIKFNYKCVVEKCGVRVSSMDNLTYHFRCHQTDSDILFCPECDFSAFNWSSLTPHLWREHEIDIDLYSCKHCNYKSNSYSKLINNHIKIHGDERPFLCDICGKGFKTTKQLRNHKSIHRARRKYSCSDRISGETEYVDLNSNLSENVCSICSRCFADSRILKHHTENVHNKARPYLCTFCSHAASSKSSLQMHIRQHTGEKPFSCDECAYVTSDHNSLRRHKMRHSGKRPYQCPHCTYNCIQATTYKSHLKNKHPGLDEGLMFSCPMCPFRTVKKDNYLAHKAEHDLGGDPLE